LYRFEGVVEAAMISPSGGGDPDEDRSVAAVPVLARSAAAIGGGVPDEDRSVAAVGSAGPCSTAAAAAGSVAGGDLDGDRSVVEPADVSFPALAGFSKAFELPVGTAVAGSLAV